MNDKLQRQREYQAIYRKNNRSLLRAKHNLRYDMKTNNTNLEDERARNAEQQRRAEETALAGLADNMGRRTHGSARFAIGATAGITKAAIGAAAGITKAAGKTEENVLEQLLQHSSQRQERRAQDALHSAKVRAEGPGVGQAIVPLASGQGHARKETPGGGKLEAVEPSLVEELSLVLPVTSTLTEGSETASQTKQTNLTLVLGVMDAGLLEGGVGMSRIEVGQENLSPKIDMTAIVQTVQFKESVMGRFVDGTVSCIVQAVASKMKRSPGCFDWRAKEDKDDYDSFDFKAWDGDAIQGLDGAACDIQAIDNTLLITTESKAFVASIAPGGTFTKTRAIDFGFVVDAASLAKLNGDVIVIGWSGSQKAYKKVTWNVFLKLHLTDIKLDDLPDYLRIASATKESWQATNLVFAKENVYGFDDDEHVFCLVGDEAKNFRDAQLRLGFTGGAVHMGSNIYKSFLVGLPKGDFAPIPNKKSILKADENKPFLLTIAPGLASTAGSPNCSFESMTGGGILSYGSESNFFHYIVDTAEFFANPKDGFTILELDNGDIGKVESSAIFQSSNTGVATSGSSDNTRKGDTTPSSITE